MLMSHEDVSLNNLKTYMTPKQMKLTLKIQMLMGSHGIISG